MIDYIQTALAQGGFFQHILVIGLVYIGGLLTSFTPCIFPMIPITFSIIGHAQPEEQPKHILVKRVLTYGLGVTLAFVGLGLVAIGTHSVFGSMTQHVVFKVIIANIFILIGLNTLGAIQMPQFHLYKQKNHTNYLGLFSMGIAAGLSLSPCTLPVLAVVLTVAAQESLLFGSLMMWTYACGFMTLILVLTIFGTTTLSSFLKKRSFLKTMDRILALLCFIVAEWLLIGAY